MPTTTDFQTISNLLPYFVKTNHVPFLAGEPGIGKSAVLKHLADQMHTKVFVLSVNQLGTREDLTGARSVLDQATNTYRQVFFPHALIQDAIDYAQAHPDETPLLFLDEINRTSPDITSAVLALITERRIGTTQLPDNIRIVAAGNDNGNVNALDTASITRMSIFHVEPSLNLFLAAQPDFNGYLKQLLLRQPDALVQLTALNQNDDDDDDEDDDDSDLDLNAIFDDNSFQQLTVPRTLTALSDLFNEIGLQPGSLPDNISDLYDPLSPEDSPLHHLVVATIGDTATAGALLDLIQTDLSRQFSNPQNQPVAKLQLPDPDRDLIKALQQASSDNTVDEIVTSYLDNNHTVRDLINTAYTVFQPLEAKQLLWPNALIHFYVDLVAQPDLTDDQNRQNNFVKKFADLLQANQIDRDLINYIQQANDPVSEHLKILIMAIA